MLSLVLFVPEIKGGQVTQYQQRTEPKKLLLQLSLFWTLLQNHPLVAKAI